MAAKRVKYWVKDKDGKIISSHVLCSGIVSDIEAEVREHVSNCFAGMFYHRHEVVGEVPDSLEHMNKVCVFLGV